MERSESGAPIFRHQDRERDFELTIGDSENIEQISNHIEEHVGPVATVFHEVISDLVHVDVHIVEPAPTRFFYTLVTSGMSDRPMKAPEEHAELRYSELVICLPPEWPMGEETWKDEENYWPIRMLKFLARMPHEYETWLWPMHTVPNGDPPAPFASNTEMSGLILLPPLSVDEGFRELEIDAEKTIHFHAVVPLYKDEMDLKLREGVDALLDGFDEHEISELLDPRRPSTVPKKKGLFGRWRRG
ncbi:MAG: suppressor of fused domain protein [Acidobacteriota bacterium]|nr:suppressor of fused domain protein [Acidimicrobiia bacterium]MDH3525029.1 suppressor of fused domain protein [Acidobacteriota bacterium]